MCSVHQTGFYDVLILCFHFHKFGADEIATQPSLWGPVDQPVTGLGSRCLQPLGTPTG